MGEQGEGSPQPLKASKDWRAPFLDFLERGILPSDVAAAHRLVRRAKFYRVLREQLYH